MEENLHFMSDQWFSQDHKECLQKNPFHVDLICNIIFPLFRERSADTQEKEKEKKKKKKID